MTQKTYKITLTRDQLICVQVALLEANLSASEDKRRTMAREYMNTYRYIGTEKRRATS